MIAGDPDRCSGKANAIAAGMAAADHDRIGWTDDDFHHPPDWLEGLRADYDRRGPTSEFPVFVGRDPLAVLLEPVYAIGATLAVYVGDVDWGGSVVFERDDVDEEEAFLADLRRTVSDDGFLTEYADITSGRRTRRVDIGGSVRETLENQVRFTKMLRYHDSRGFVGNALVASLLTAAGILFPPYAFAALSLLLGGVYAAFGIRRWTFLLAFPATVLSIPFVVYWLGVDRSSGPAGATGGTTSST